MRLLHTTALKLTSFIDPERDAPPYAILSHTWGPQEILFEDVHPQLSELATRKAGFAKVKGACARARADGYDYIWIDTLCIDKSSSTELSEAINAMFRWYACAKVCYVYMADVDELANGGGGDDTTTTAAIARVGGSDGFGDGPIAAGALEPILGESGSAALIDPSETVSSPSELTAVPFARSRWFTRGWTLQELIAPPDVVFFGRRWGPRPLGTRLTLADALRERTGVDRLLLTRKVVAAGATNAAMVAARLRVLGAAHKMGWASGRHTTRPEDAAYCLLGILDVAMPLLYGEGARRAFLRLQEEVVKVHESDQSVLLWRSPKVPMVPRTVHGEGGHEDAGGGPGDQGDGGDEELVTSDMNGFYPLFGSSSALFPAVEAVWTLPGSLALPSLIIASEGLRIDALICPVSYDRGVESGSGEEEDKDKGQKQTTADLPPPGRTPLYLVILQCSIENDVLRRPALLVYNVGEALYGTNAMGKSYPHAFARATPDYYFVKPGMRELEVLLPYEEAPIKLAVNLSKTSSTWILLIKPRMSKEFANINTAIPFRVSHRNASRVKPFTSSSAAAIYRNLRPEVPVWTSSLTDISLSTTLSRQHHVVIGAVILDNHHDTACFIIWGLKPASLTAGPTTPNTLVEGNSNEWWKTRDYFCRIFSWDDAMAGGAYGPELLATLKGGSGLIWHKPFWARFVNYIQNMDKKYGMEDISALESKHKTRVKGVSGQGTVTAEVKLDRWLGTDFLKLMIDIDN